MYNNRVEEVVVVVVDPAAFLVVTNNVVVEEVLRNCNSNNNVTCNKNHPRRPCTVEFTTLRRIPWARQDMAFTMSMSTWAVGLVSDGINIHNTNMQQRQCRHITAFQ